MPNEISDNSYGYYRYNYRACTGSGDMYGNSVDSTSGPWGLGSFGVKSGQSFDTSDSLGTRIADITDGTSSTLMLSEGLVPGPTPSWGGRAWFDDLWKHGRWIVLGRAHAQFDFT